MDERLTESDIGGAEWFIGGVGGVLTLLSIWYAVAFSPPAQFTPHPSVAFGLHALEVVLMILFSLSILYVSYWYRGSDYTNEQKWWVGLWLVMGLSGVVAVVVLVQSNQVSEGRGIATQTIVEELLLAAGGGAIVGLFTGMNNADLRREQEQTASQRDTFEFVNDFLRHNVLNGMQEIVGYASLLEGEYDDRADKYLGHVRRRGERITYLIQNIRTLAQSVASAPDLGPVDLSSVLAEVLEESESQFPDATFERSLESGVHVRADRFLPTLYSTLLSDAVGHAVRDAPRVVVSLERNGDHAVVRIVDDGLAVPEDDVEGYFQRGGERAERAEPGLGQYLLEMFAERYNGDVWVDSDEESGAVLGMSFPLAAYDRSRSQTSG